MSDRRSILAQDPMRILVNVEEHVTNRGDVAPGARASSSGDCVDADVHAVPGSVLFKQPRLHLFRCRPRRPSQLAVHALCRRSSSGTARSSRHIRDTFEETAWPRWLPARIKAPACKSAGIH